MDDMQFNVKREEISIISTALRHYIEDANKAATNPQMTRGSEAIKQGYEAQANAAEQCLDRFLNTWRDYWQGCEATNCVS